METSSPATADGMSVTAEEDVDNERQRKRRSWKQHRLGMGAETPYVCDQCDKSFSKQSSLARHKYEHSGEHANNVIGHINSITSSVNLVILLI